MISPRPPAQVWVFPGSSGVNAYAIDQWLTGLSSVDRMQKMFHAGAFGSILLSDLWVEDWQWQVGSQRWEKGYIQVFNQTGFVPLDESFRVAVPIDSLLLFRMDFP